MKIICPQCDFIKDVSEERFPSANFMATCPKCKHRFKVSTEKNEVQDDKSFSNPDSTPNDVIDARIEDIHDDRDDALPPSAVIPSNYKDTNSIADRDEASQNDLDDVDDTDEARQNDKRSEYRERNDVRSEHLKKNEDLLQRASSAYEDESRRSEEEENDGFAIDNPWDNSKNEGYVSSFYQTVIRIMFFAPRFFAGLSGNMSLIRSLIFYVIVVVVQILISFFWASTVLQYISSPVDDNNEINSLLVYLSGTSLPMVLLSKTAFSVTQLYVTSFIYYLSFSIVSKEKVDFSLVFQVIAYSIAPLLLSVVPLLGSLVGVVWAIACSFIGCRYALRLTIMQTVLALAPIYMLIFPLLYIIISASAQG